MAFMVPQYEHCQWLEIDGPDGTEWVAVDLVFSSHAEARQLVKTWQAWGNRGVPRALADYCENGEIWGLEMIKGWGCRLSAPGYMDRTDWCVFLTRDEAREHIADTYEVCPECGEEPGEDGEFRCCEDEG